MTDQNITPPKAEILIVDDDVQNLRLLTTRLSQEGYKVRPVTNGQMALTTARKSPPDLILLDIVMPDMDGFAVCDYLKQDEKTFDIPIIFISIKQNFTDKVKAFEVGAVDYISRPFEFEEVFVRLHTHLTLHKLQKELENRVQEQAAELIALNTAYERFVPREFLNFLSKRDATEVELSDHVQRQMNISFTDIHNFGELSRNMLPQKRFRFINAYLNRVSPVIRQHQGFIDKYINHQIMALFPRKAKNALDAAIMMQQEVSDYNAYRQQQGERPIKIGSSIHSGKMMLGIIGSEERLQGTVIADAVNTAARMSGLTKFYGASLVISEQALGRIEGFIDYKFRFLGKVQVKGKKDPVSIFEIFEADSEIIRNLKLETKPIFEDGLFLYYDKKFAEASVKFSLILEENPDDKAARLYLERSARFMVEGVPADWAGVEALTSK